MSRRANAGQPRRRTATTARTALELRREKGRKAERQEQRAKNAANNPPREMTNHAIGRAATVRVKPGLGLRITPRTEEEEREEGRANQHQTTIAAPSASTPRKNEVKSEAERRKAGGCQREVVRARSGRLSQCLTDPRLVERVESVSRSMPAELAVDANERPSRAPRRSQNVRSEQGTRSSEIRRGAIGESSVRLSRRGRTERFRAQECACTGAPAHSIVAATGRTPSAGRRSRDSTTRAGPRPATPRRFPCARAARGADAGDREQS